MKNIIFFDIEINSGAEQIFDIGALAENGEVFHLNSLKNFNKFLSDTKYICGHNIIKHDLDYLQKHTNNSYSSKFSIIDRIIYLLRDKPCVSGDDYCNTLLDAEKGLKKFFGFDSFRTFEGESLQEDAINAAIKNKSLLAIFPTGSGKSLTFQIPALMSGENYKGLTVVVLSLQSLMKDQILGDNFLDTYRYSKLHNKKTQIIN